MLDEGRDASRLPGCDKSANFFNLIVRKGDGDLCRCHTKDHTIGAVRFESCLRLNKPATLRGGAAKDVLKTRSALRWPKEDSNLKTRRLEVLLSRGVPLFNRKIWLPSLDTFRTFAGCGTCSARSRVPICRTRRRAPDWVQAST